MGTSEMSERNGAPTHRQLRDVAHAPGAAGADPTKAMTAAKDDQGKWQFSLFPLNAVREIAKVLHYGAYEKPRADGTKGYGKDNWQGVPDARVRYFNAAIRHLTSFYEGERYDAEGLHHLACAGCCVLFLLALDLRGVFDPQTRPSRAAP
jgi:hypothetical protein